MSKRLGGRDRGGGNPSLQGEKAVNPALLRQLRGRRAFYGRAVGILWFRVEAIKVMAYVFILLKLGIYRSRNGERKVEGIDDSKRPVKTN
jgi:hypothetical protein